MYTIRTKYVWIKTTRNNTEKMKAKRPLYVKANDKKNGRLDAFTLIRNMQR